jgi:hypothetical protein
MTDEQLAVQISASWLAYYTEAFAAMKVHFRKEPCVYARFMEIFMERHFWPFVRQQARHAKRKQRTG